MNSLQFNYLRRGINSPITHCEHTKSSLKQYLIHYKEALIDNNSSRHLNNYLNFKQEFDRVCLQSFQPEEIMAFKKRMHQELNRTYPADEYVLWISV
jgi:hypothetical protein